MRTLAIINQKGGCGKTTTAINLAALLGRYGQRTLLVDMDPQSHCAAGFGIPESRFEHDIGDAMIAGVDRPIEAPRLLWRCARNVDLAPSRMKLAGLEASRGGLAELMDREKRLAMVLRRFKHDYDVACIDCPPSIGLLTYNALAASDLILIPVETSYFALQGAAKQVTTVRTLSRRLGVQTPVWILPTIHDAASTVAGDILAELHRRFKDRVVPVVIRRDPRLREAASYGQSVIDYCPTSTGAEDYGKLAQWAVEVLGGRIEQPMTAGDEPLEGPEIAVPAVSPRVLADRPESPGDAGELKPANRAEDVAKRAQEFLRRVALGRGTLHERPTPPASGTTQASTTPMPSEPASVTVVAPEPACAPSLRLIERPEVRAVSISPTAVRTPGVHESNQGVLFVQPLACGSKVAIAGTFNGWSPTTHVMRRNTSSGVHELCLRLPPGKFLYRLVIDGQWTADPHNNACEPNPYGDTNSVLVVGAARPVEQSA